MNSNDEERNIESMQSNTSSEASSFEESYEPTALADLSIPPIEADNVTSSTEIPELEMPSFTDYDASFQRAVIDNLPLIVLGTLDEEIFVQRLRIAASQLRRAADGALCEAQRLQEEFLLGWPASALVLESVRNDFTNASLGYSIKADATEAGHRRVQQRLVERVFAQEALRNRFVEVINEDEGVVCRLAEAEAYLCKCHQFIKVRSLYYVAGQVFLFGRYSNKGITKFLSKRVSWVLLLDLLVIRFFVASLFSRLHSGRGKEYLPDLFVVDGRRQEGEDLRRYFAQKFLAFSGVPLPFSLYRHVAKHFSLKMKGQLYDGTGTGYEESDEEEEQDGFERQFGLPLMAKKLKSLFQSVLIVILPGVLQFANAYLFLFCSSHSRRHICSITR